GEWRVVEEEGDASVIGGCGTRAGTDVAGGEVERVFVDRVVAIVGITGRGCAATGLCPGAVGGAAPGARRAGRRGAAAPAEQEDGDEKEDDDDDGDAGEQRGEFACGAGLLGAAGRGRRLLRLDGERRGGRHAADYTAGRRPGRKAAWARRFRRIRSRGAAADRRRGSRRRRP